MEYLAIFPTVAFLLNTVVWSYVLGQRRKEPVNLAFLLFSASTGGWLLTDLLTYLPWARGFESFIYKVQGVFWVPIGFLFAHFAYALAGRKPDALHGFALLISLISTIFFLFTDYFISGYYYFDWGIVQDFNRWPHLALGLVPSCCSVVGLYAVLLKWIESKDSLEKKTIGLIFVGGMVTLTGAFVLNLVVPTILGINNVPRLGSSALGLFILIVFFAVTKYRFLSISVEQVAEELFEDLSEGVLLVNRFGVIERDNRSARHLLGCSTPLVGKRETEIFPGRPGVDGRPCRSFEMIVEGASRILSVSASTYARRGTPLGRMLVLRDVTEERRAEEVLRRSRDELEREVERRTEQLRQAQRMEAIGTFAGAIAHDFNNLLAAILGFANAARNDTPEGSSVRSDLDEVILAGKRAKDIVRQVLAFSRRQDKTDFQVVLIRDVVKENLDLLRVSLPTTIILDYDIDECDGAVRCDPAQIGQVIMNLGTNAFHAMRDMSHGRLSVKLEAVMVDREFAEQHPPIEPGDYLRVSMSDTGCGMDAATVSRIFDPFFTTKCSGEGTGLGLSTALGIAKSHDGTISVDSARNKGSTFHLYLPEVPRESQHTVVEETTVAKGTERVLLVDDEPQLLRMGVRMLSPLGYSVTAVSSGKDALKALESASTPFDIVLTDQTMPEMTGRELASEIHRLYPMLPVVLMSGGGQAPVSTGAPNADIRMFLKKPAGVDEVSAAIRCILDCGQTGDAKSKQASPERERVVG